MLSLWVQLGSWAQRVPDQQQSASVVPIDPGPWSQILPHLHVHSPGWPAHAPWHSGRFRALSWPTFDRCLTALAPACKEGNKTCYPISTTATTTSTTTVTTTVTILQHRHHTSASVRVHCATSRFKHSQRFERAESSAQDMPPHIAKQLCNRCHHCVDHDGIRSPPT